MSVGEKPRVVDVEVPEPGPGQLLLKVAAAGVCHSDLAVMSWPAEQFPYELPMTLGHEGANRRSRARCRPPGGARPRGRSTPTAASPGCAGAQARSRGPDAAGACRENARALGVRGG
ncbi:alcohol dehydrogenase catalytic domain-containing protein [Streptomonospora algeriensis]|uniref:alcohol dehydrogenase n=1 Tax=Streptomonospora algeriensis TaxID=995084 RepID=A0ABW3BGE6_9ACTN